MKKALNIILSCVLSGAMLLGGAFASNVTTQEGTVVPENFILIPADPAFTFSTDLGSVSGAGESSPLEDDYYMCKYYITYADWRAFCDATGREYPENWTEGAWGQAYGTDAQGQTLYLPTLEDKADHPIMYVGYEDVTDYCEWYAQENPGWFFRLPTEAEWENAARGGLENCRFPWGDEAPTYQYNSETGKGEGTVYELASYAGYMAANLIDLLGYDYEFQVSEDGETYTLGQMLTKDGVFNSGTPYNWSRAGDGFTEYFTHSELYSLWNKGVAGMSTAVGFFEPNGYGLYDATGNCWTLTSTHRPGVFGPEVGSDCVSVRGGSFYAQANSITTTFRRETRSITSAGNNTVGARLVAEEVGEEFVVYYHVTNECITEDDGGILCTEPGSTDIVYHRLLTEDGLATNISEDGTLAEYLFVPQNTSQSDEGETSVSGENGGIAVNLLTLDGWYTDLLCTQSYDFTQPVEGSLHLYACYANTGLTGQYAEGTATLSID